MVWLLCFQCFGIASMQGLSCKKKRMYCHTCRVLEILVRFLFWSRQWYGGLVFALWWIQAAVFWALTTSWPFFYLALFSRATSVIINDTVFHCTKRPQAGVLPMPKDTDSKRYLRMLKWSSWIIFSSWFLF